MSINIKNIEGYVSFDEAIEWLSKYPELIKKHKEESNNDYLDRSDFNTITACRISLMEALIKLIKQYLDEMDEEDEELKLVKYDIFSDPEFKTDCERDQIEYESKKYNKLNKEN